MKRTILPLLSVAALGPLHGQLPIGEWRDHYPYAQARAVAQGDGVAYCATRNAVFTLRRSTGEMERLTKVNALSDVDITAMAYDPTTRLLVVGYRNGNLDLIRGRDAVNLADIKRSNLIGDKAIYAVRFLGDRAYLSCGFGVVVLDITRNEVRETWFIAPGGTQMRINDLAFVGDSVYAVSDNGLYAAWRDAPNLAAFTSWRKRTDVPQPDGPFTAVNGFDGRLLVNHRRPNGFDEDTLFHFSDGQWERLTALYGQTNQFLEVDPSAGRLLVTTRYGALAFDTGLQEVNAYYGVQGGDGELRPLMAVSAGSGVDVWIADAQRGLVLHPAYSPGIAQAPNGPGTTSAHRMAMRDGVLMVTTGSPSGTWGNTFRTEGVHRFANGHWHTIDRTNDALMATGSNPFGNTVFDPVAVTLDPDNVNRAYVGTWDEGLLRLDGDAVTAIFNTSNSALQLHTALGPDSVIYVGGLAWDEGGNLWMTNSWGTKPLVVRTKSGAWRSFQPGNLLGSELLLGDLLVNKTGVKWAIRPRGKGLLVYDDRGTLSDPGDDRFKVLGTQEGSGGLPSPEVFAIAEDKDGEIWVGTDRGIAVFYNPDGVFNAGGSDAQQILIEQDGNVQILLETETVTAIAVDGADRKWLGTRSGGLFLVSADGRTRLEHFTAENSPLPSNSINALAIDERTGEVYIATEQGIVSYRGTATEGGRSNTCASVYPNPVRETYSGPVAITGLMRDSDVRITDVAGNLVYRTTSLGGQAIWDAHTLSGERVATGVYLILATDREGTYKCNTKVLVVR